MHLAYSTSRFDVWIGRNRIGNAIAMIERRSDGKSIKCEPLAATNLRRQIADIPGADEATIDGLLTTYFEPGR